MSKRRSVVIQEFIKNRMHILIHNAQEIFVFENHRKCGGGNPGGGRLPGGGGLRPSR